MRSKASQGKKTKVRRERKSVTESVTIYDILLDDKKVEKLRKVCYSFKGKAGFDYGENKTIPLTGFCSLSEVPFDKICEVIDGHK